MHLEQSIFLWELSTSSSINTAIAFAWISTHQIRPASTTHSRHRLPNWFLPRSNSLLLMASSSPLDPTFAMDQTEKKMDMTLDDIIKMSRKKAKQQRISIKDRNRNRFGQQAKAFRQTSLVSRSSILPQGMLAEPRVLNGNGRIVDTEVAARKAISTPISLKTNRKRRSRRSRNFARRRAVLYAAAAATNMRISVSNSATMNREIRNGARPPVTGYRSITWIRQSRGVPRSSSKMDLYDDSKNCASDSIFASIKRQRIRSRNGLRGVFRRNNWSAC